MAKKTDRTQRPQVILEGGDAPKTVDLAEVPNSILKQLLVSGSDAAWDEAIDRIAQKSDRGDYEGKATPAPARQKAAETQTASTPRAAKGRAER